jgi:hypothetical protein
MNKWIEPKSLLEVRAWKRKATAMIEKYGLREAERRGAEAFQRDLEEVRRKKKTAKTHS